MAPSRNGVSPLSLRLADRIRAQGPLPLAEFMAAAITRYYATRDPFGMQGDFVTAPEVSQVFGELIGLSLAELWQRMGAPDPIIVAELGPGRGTLMTDALRAARIVPGFLAAAKLHLVETSPVLRAAQARALTEAKPRWHAAASELPAGPLLLVANEFLDALPIRQWQCRSGTWHERMVGFAEGEFVFLLDPKPAPLELPAAPEGSIVEHCPAAIALARLLAQRLVNDGGAALFIDYGHERSGIGDTLQAVRAHQRHPVLALPGEADLTSHVDFAAFAAAARGAGARVLGPVSQAEYLRALGIEARTAALLGRATPAQTQAIESGYRRLLARTEMGLLFKALAITGPQTPPPAGFDR